MVSQPVLGRAADVWGYGSSYLLGAGISALALPFIYLSRREQPSADEGTGTPEQDPKIEAPEPVPAGQAPPPND